MQKRFSFKMLIKTELTVKDLEEKNSKPKEKKRTTRKDI